MPPARPTSRVWKDWRVLEELHVSNLGILADARVEPGSGLVVVTGETGTGKTMLLGALALLSGEIARRDRVGPAADELKVEGRFRFGDDEVVATRRVRKDGRSKAYLDGAMVTAKGLAARIGPLIEIVAQDDSLNLSKPAGVLSLLDSALSDRGRGIRADYDRAWTELVRLRREQIELGGDGRSLARDLEAARQQADEIADAGLAPGEDRDIRIKADRLRNAEEMTAGLGAAHAALVDDGGALDRMGSVIAELRRIVAWDPSLDSTYTGASALSDAMSELGADLAAVASELDHDPAGLEAVESRIRLLSDLRRKYGDTIDEVIRFGEEAERRAAELQRRMTSRETLDGDIAKVSIVLVEHAAALHAERAKAAKKLAKGATRHLQQLGMGDPIVRFELTPVEPGPGGGDRAVLMFASDASLDAGPLRRIASGGELSRLVLSLRLASGAGDVPVVAFDEIDAGVGGATALAMGEKLARLAAGRQVLCVSHLPQIAAFADMHVVVERDGISASVRAVEGNDRDREIARMLAGLGDSASGAEHAADLLAEARMRLADPAP